MSLDWGANDRHTQPPWVVMPTAHRPALCLSTPRYSTGCYPASYCPGRDAVVGVGNTARGSGTGAGMGNRGRVWGMSVGMGDRGVGVDKRALDIADKPVGAGHGAARGDDRVRVGRTNCSGVSTGHINIRQ